MNFDIRNLFVINIGGVEVWITETQVVTWMIMAVLITFAVIVRRKLRKFENVPKSKLQQFTEVIVDFFDRFVRSTAGNKLAFLGNWFFAVFAMIFLSSFSGLFGFRPPTADWSFTFAMALVTFMLIQVLGIKFRGKGYLKGLMQPAVVFLPTNIIGELSRPVSLSFRLFGNVLAGLILLTLIYTLPPVPFRFGLPVVLHAYFDLISGFLQTYIFCVLSLSFISGAAGVELE